MKRVETFRSPEQEQPSRYLPLHAVRAEDLPEAVRARYEAVAQDTEGTLVAWFRKETDYLQGYDVTSPPDDPTDWQITTPDVPIRQARGLDELESVVGALGHVPGSSGVHPAGEIKQTLQMIERNTAGFEEVTRTYGLREQVIGIVGDRRNGRGEFLLPRADFYVRTGQEHKLDQLRTMIREDFAENYVDHEGMIRDAIESQNPITPDLIRNMDTLPKERTRNRHSLYQDILNLPVSEHADATDANLTYIEAALESLAKEAEHGAKNMSREEAYELLSDFEQRGLTGLNEKLAEVAERVRLSGLGKAKRFLRRKS